MNKFHSTILTFLFRAGVGLAIGNGLRHYLDHDVLGGIFFLVFALALILLNWWVCWYSKYF